MPPAGRPSSSVPHKALHGVVIQGRAPLEWLRPAAGHDHSHPSAATHPLSNHPQDRPTRVERFTDSRHRGPQEDTGE